MHLSVLVKLLQSSYEAIVAVSFSSLVGIERDDASSAELMAEARAIRKHLLVHLFDVSKHLLEELSHPYDRKKHHVALASSMYGVSRMNTFKA